MTLYYQTFYVTSCVLRVRSLQENLKPRPCSIIDYQCILYIYYIISNCQPITNFGNVFSKAEKYGQFADSTSARASTQEREKQKGVEKRRTKEIKYYRQGMGITNLLALQLL